MNLVKAELSRFFSRRFIQIMLIVLAAAFAITVMTVMAESQTPSEYMWQQANEQAERQRQYREQQFANCIEKLSDPLNPAPDNDPARCASLDPSRVHAEDYLWSVFNFGREIEDLVKVLGVFLAFFGFLVAASFVGSELHSGGMTNLLLWRPNRLAVLGAKLGVAIGSVAAISVVYTALYVGTFYAIASTTGWVGDTAGTFWSDLFWLCVRAWWMAIIMGLIAFAIAVIGRHTAAALGALIAYVVVWEIGARVVVEAVNMHGYGSDDEHLFFSSYLYTWIEGPQDRYFCYDCGSYLPVSWASSAAVLVLVASVSIAIAFGTFHRRDLA